MDVNSLSIPPSEEELENLIPVEPDKLPRKYTRDIDGRIFVNRSVNLDHIEYFGCIYLYLCCCVHKWMPLFSHYCSVSIVFN